jgi:hypothetical protein
VIGVQAEVIDHREELVHEQLGAPELCGSLWSAGGAATSELVVQDDSPAGLVREFGETPQVVMAEAGPSMQDDQRQRPRPGSVRSRSLDPGGTVAERNVQCGGNRHCAPPFVAVIVASKRYEK